MVKSLRQLLRKIREISQRYEKPRIEMSFGVRASLMALRIYLMILVVLITYKFILLLR